MLFAVVKYSGVKTDVIEEVEKMGYQVKWVEDNLGISRKAIRNYEKNGLIPKDGSRAQNNYREYDEDDIDQLWGIKILQGIGFSVKEIKRMIDDPKTDFYKAITEKVTELEKKRHEIDQYISFAKTIKMTGRVPNVTKVGSMRYDDYIKHVREEWNIYRDQKLNPLLNFMEDVITPEGISTDNISVERLEEIAKVFLDYKDNLHDCQISAYFQILTELQTMDYKSSSVQSVVNLLYNFIRNNKKEYQESETFNPQFFARYTITCFVPGSDMYQLEVRDHGEEGCKFIAEAVAYFAGYESLDDFLEE